MDVGILISGFTSCVSPRWVWRSVDRCKVVLVDLWASDNLWYSVDGLKESGQITSLNAACLQGVKPLLLYFLNTAIITSVRMSAGTPVAMRMVQSCCSRPHWYMDFWQLAVAPGEFTGDTITRTNWEQNIVQHFNKTSHCSACLLCN